MVTFSEIKGRLRWCQMSYQAFLPSSILRPYVERYVLLDSPAIHRNGDLMPPGGVSGLIINLGADYHIQLSQTTKKLPALGVGGQLTQVMQLRAPTNIRLLLINFHPMGLYQLFGLPMSELTNQIVEVDALFPLAFRQSWNCLPDQLREIDQPLTLIRRVEAQLLTCLSRAKHSPNHWMNAATNWLAQPGDRRVQQLTTELRISPRQLARQFTQQVGIAPKSYARVMRFRHLFRAATSSNCPSWQDLIHAGGWYDQAHFINDFYELTGQTPSAFFGQQHTTAQVMLSEP